MPVGKPPTGHVEIPMKIAFIALSLMLATAAAACNTIKGAGQDVSATGDAVSDAAQDAKPN